MPNYFANLWKYFCGHMKAHILGASGSGVTTLGRALSEATGKPYFDSDDYYWEQKFTIKRPASKRNASMKAALEAREDWILGGSVVSWGEEVFPAFDLIVFLWIPREVRIKRLMERESERYGSAIQTDPVRKKLHDEFMDWAEGYDVPGATIRSLSIHEAWMEKQTCRIVQIRGDTSTAERVQICLKEFIT
jgi:adenylate kinase family enzyme